MSLDVAVSSELSLVFPTPILLRTLFTDSFNDRLARAVLSRRRHGGGTRASGGGWQSSPDVLTWPELEVKLLIAEVVDVVQRMSAMPISIDEESRRSTLLPHRFDPPANDAQCGDLDISPTSKPNYPYHARAWANVNGDGHYNPLRVQAGYQWCAIYHVAMGRPTPDRPANGVLEIMDPRPAAPFGNMERFAFGQPIEIEPKPGLVVVFPAWLQYSVHPFFGMGHRISITMNITLEED